VCRLIPTDIIELRNKFFVIHYFKCVMIGPLESTMYECFTFMLYETVHCLIRNSGVNGIHVTSHRNQNRLCWYVYPSSPHPYYALVILGHDRKLWIHIGLETFQSWTTLPHVRATVHRNLGRPFLPQHHRNCPTALPKAMPFLYPIPSHPGERSSFPLLTQLSHPPTYFRSSISPIDNTHRLPPSYY
jgi:hypothetical protein